MTQKRILPEQKGRNGNLYLPITDAFEDSGQEDHVTCKFAMLRRLAGYSI